MFRPALEKARDKGPKSHVGAKGYDVILLFKIRILQSLYNLSDDATEYRILDRHSFGRFLGLHLSRKVPDATTIRRFREDLVRAGIVEKLFAIFATHLRANGCMAMRGRIVDASIVNVPRQCNSRDENAKIKEREVPDWPENKHRHKDVETGPSPGFVLGLSTFLVFRFNEPGICCCVRLAYYGLRAWAKIGLRNPAYNIDRMGMLPATKR
jgi:Transposase and inactivated derivatives, IS5 family